MLGFRRPLLLLTEGSDAQPALERALRVARGEGAELTVLGIAEPEPADASTYADGGDGVHAEAARQLAALGDTAATLAAAARAAGLPAEHGVVRGVVQRVAVEAAVRGSHDLILKVADHEPGSRLAHGALDRQLLRKCPAPLWLEQARAPRQLRRILVAVNPDPNAPEDCDLALDLLASAAAVAAADSAELHVLHAWKLFGEGRPTSAPAGDTMVTPLLGAALNRHASYLEAALSASGLTDRPLQRHLVHQRASQAILAALRAQPFDLLVIGTVGRTGIAGFFIGNTAEKVLPEVDCSILARKPSGFRSPLFP